jgi:hypothetical protein
MDQSTGLCLPRDSNGNYCTAAELNSATDVCNDPQVADREGNQCYQSQLTGEHMCPPQDVNASTYTDYYGRTCAPSNANGYGECQLNSGTTTNCPSGFAPGQDGGCIDERHQPCPPGYSGWQNSQLDNCLQKPDPLQTQ